ncbi:MAG: lamin tail domain-containing protein, partial [Caldilineaceae bacterium]
MSTLFISEFLADPAAVSDANGEWVELYNAGPDGVNLKDWTLADLDSDQHTIASDLFLAPGQFVVLGRNGNLLENGGVALSYIYAGFTLANGEDEIRLLRPDGTEEDRVIWGGESSLRTTPGKSLERTGFGPVAVWLVAETPWPGSAGDFGTPGRGFEPPAATETATATGTADSGQQTATATTTPATTPATPAMTTTPSVTSTPTPSATSVSLPARWPPRAEPAPLRIDEVNFLGSDLEFVVLVNVGDAPVDLTGWLVGDGAVPGGGEGLYELPPGHFLAPNTPFVIARNGAAFHVRWGQPAHAQFENSASAAPVLARRRELASGSLALNDSGDEVLLLDPSLNLADAVVWGNGDGASLGLTGTLYPVADRSLQRVPGFAFPDQREQRHRFLWAAPAPFASVTLPESAVLPSPPLADGLQAVWGSLGATSSFSPGGAAPPHYVQAAGAHIGLHFVAIADPPETPADRATGNAPAAWRWTGNDGSRAIVYGPSFATDGTVDSFVSGLASHGALAQWMMPAPPPAPADAFVALAGDGVTVPTGLAALSRGWQSGPLLPAGNAQPSVADEAPPNPRYTGLAAQNSSPSALRDALAARRGWLTNRPGLALTLQAHTSSGENVWMGSTIPPHNALAVEVNYYDATGEMASLAVWQNDRPVAQTELAQANGLWSVTLSAAPGSVLYAVATQADGDFALTAPLLVENGQGAAVVINEVLAAPTQDYNGDGNVNSGDEYIELYNP